jgi:hypothetical protein
MKEWSFWDCMAYAGLALAVVIEAAEAGLKNAPQVAAKIPDIFPSVIAPFIPLGLVVVATLILLLRYGPHRRPPDNPHPRLETYIRLQFHHGAQEPDRIDSKNIFRCYSTAALTGVQPNQQGSPMARVVARWLFLIFDRPVRISRLRLDPSGAQLPIHEVKSFSSRHAVVWILGDLAGTVINFQVVHD